MRADAAPGEVRCTVCNGIGSAPLLSKAHDGRGPGPIFLRKCLECEVVFLKSWSEGFEPRLYDYYMGRASADKTDIYSSITEARYEELLASFDRLAPGKKALDVGCGQGQFVDVALRRGWDVLGIELSEPAVAICKKFGLPVEKMDLFSTALEAGSFSLLTLFEVVEHVPYPSKFLRRAEELLRPGGLLYLTTPNFDSLDRRLAGSSWHAIHREHLTYFTPKTMEGLISTNTRLALEYLRTRNMSVSALGSLLKGRAPEPKSSGSFVSDASDVPEGSSLRDVERGEDLRERIESSAVLRALKSIANRALDGFGLGADMAVLCRKRA